MLMLTLSFEGSEGPTLSEIAAFVDLVKAHGGGEDSIFFARDANGELSGMCAWIDVTSAAVGA